MIEFKDVAFQYEQGSSKGKIENINLTIHDGEVVLICGESGCGKTTLTRLSFVWCGWFCFSKSKDTIFYSGYYQ